MKRRTVLLGALTAAVAPALPRTARAAVPQRLSLPLVFDGRKMDVAADLFRPAGATESAATRLILFSHGRAPEAAARAALRYPVPPSAAAWWTDRGFSILAPIRPGYGATGGEDRESSHAIGRGGVCSPRPDFAGASERAAQTILAALDWARTQALFEPAAVLLVGQSMGGFSTVAAAATNPAGVFGFVNFAGGTGGDPTVIPRHSCRPDIEAGVFAAYGRTTRVPSLWLYAENDLFWGPDVPRTWFDAFAAGGSEATFAGLPPVGENGHALITAGPQLWHPPFDAFLRKLGHQTPGDRASNQSN